MAVDLGPSKKKSRAEYFREYRRRKSTAQENLALVESKPKMKTSKSNPMFSLSLLHRLGLILIAICTTAYLIFVSASYLEGPLWLRNCLALLSETILLVLITLNTTTLIDRLLRSSLLLAFLIYSVLPFVTEPLKKHTDQIQAQTLINQERASLEREINHLNIEHQKLLEHERLTKAHNVAQQLATLESELRATFVSDRTLVQQASRQKLPPWVLAVQRLLFVFFNLFLVHYLAATVVAQQKCETKATVIQKNQIVQSTPLLHLVSNSHYPLKQPSFDKLNIWSRFKLALHFFIEGKVGQLEHYQSD